MGDEKPEINLNEQAMIENLSVMRQQLMKNLLDPVRDIDEACHYPKVITTEMYSYMYEREGVAQRVVGLEPEDSWALDPEIEDNEDPEDTEFEKAWTKLADEKNLLHFLHRIDELSGIGRFGVMLLGLSDGEELSKPVDGISEKGVVTGRSTPLELMYLRVFDEAVVKIKSTEGDKTNPRFGKPTVYQINFQETTENEDTTASDTTSQDKLVHWSRIIHIADNRKTSEVYGVPRMKKVYNRLMDIRKILSGSGEMFWKGAFPGYSFEMDPKALEDGATIDPDSIRAEFEKYSNGLQRYLATKGLTVKSLAPQVADPKSHMETELRYIAITLSIPFRIFMGTEEAKLASSQDTDTWNKRIARRQDKYVTPLVIRPFIDRLIGFGVLPVPEEETYTVKWPDLSTPSETTAAEVMVKKTEALAKYVSGDVSAIMPPEVYLDMIMLLDSDEIKTIMEEAMKNIRIGTDDPEEKKVPAKVVPAGDEE